MSSKIKIALLFLISFVGFKLGAQETPVNILNKAVNAISAANGIEANFKVFNSGYSGSGTIKTLGNKFKVTLPDVAVWYNGQDLYTYNSRTNEVTVTIPTDEELAESNPLAYVTRAKNGYNVIFSTVKKDGRYVLELTPKSKGVEIKRITLTLKKSSYLPEKIVVEPLSGNPISADITSFKTSVKLSPNEFNFPKSQYPKAELIDLR